MRNLETFGNIRIRTARAYSSVYNEKARWWPEANFTDCVKYALENPGKEKFDILVMSAPTVDITNLDTSKMSPNDNTEIFQENAIKSAQNIFNLAQKSLKMNPNLKQVVLMEHPPSFDRVEVDPISLKSNLARLANSTLSQLWLNSPLRNKIVIGRHSLESSGSGAAHLTRYENMFTGRYDGVHFYGQTGRRDYTDSVKSIMMLALPEHITTKTSPEFDTAQHNNHNSCPQMKHQQKQAFQSVPTRNRFSMFNQGNF